MISFSGLLFPTAHLLAHLRIAVVVTHSVARLATDLLVSALVRRALHPLDGSSEFQDMPKNLSFLSDQPFLVTSSTGFLSYMPLLEASRRGPSRDDRALDVVLMTLFEVTFLTPGGRALD